MRPLRRFPVIAFAVAFFGAAALAPVSAFSMTVLLSDQNGNTQNSGNSVVNPTTAWYPVIRTGGPTPLLDLQTLEIAPDPTPLTMGTVISQGATDPNAAIYFVIESTVGETGGVVPAPGTATGGPWYLIVLSGNTSPKTLVPIAYVASFPSGGAITNCFNGNNTPGQLCTSYAGNGAAYAANWVPGQSLLVGIFPADICNSSILSTAGCSSTINVPGNSTGPGIAVNGSLSYGINFAIITDAVSNPPAVVIPPAAGPINDIQYFLTNTTVTNVPISGGAGINIPDISTNTVTVNLQADPGITSCPPDVPISLLDTLYFPGDGQILLNTLSTFGLVTAISPPASVIAVANVVEAATNGPAPTPATLTLPPANTTFTGYSFGPALAALNSPGTTVPNSTGPGAGLTNSDATNSFYYTFGFAMQDSAGFVSLLPPGETDPNYCLLPNVRVSHINGFLKQNSCFIANAAFGDPSAAPVDLLRRFRDGYLIHFGMGQRFVHWYYRWSPAAADWLRAHPALRPTVLLLLAPLEATAWIFLNPLLASLFLLTSLLGLFAVVVVLKIRFAERPSDPHRESGH
jgi:hypothetical protein